MVDPLIYPLIDWSIVWSIDSLIHWLIHWLAYWIIDIYWISILNVIKGSSFTTWEYSINYLFFPAVAQWQSKKEFDFESVAATMEVKMLAKISDHDKVSVQLEESKYGDNIYTCIYWWCTTQKKQVWKSQIPVRGLPRKRSLSNFY